MQSSTSYLVFHSFEKFKIIFSLLKTQYVTNLPPTKQINPEHISSFNIHNEKCISQRLAVKHCTWLDWHCS